MSTLSNTLVNKFVSATNDSSSTSTTTTTAYGTVTVSGSTVYVTVDGSETATPVSSSATTVRQGDRVVVTIQNHTATITTNLTTTAALVSTEDVANTSDLALRVAALEASMITSDYLAKYYASIESLTNSSADLDVNTLTSKEITVETLSALGIDVTSLTGDSASFKYLTADSAEFKTLSANVATLQSASVKYLTVDMANIDTANIDTETVKNLFVSIGILTNATVEDAYITGTLNGVQINAECITTGTLSVEHLLIVGENSIVYEINANSSGLTQTELTDEEYQKRIDGTALVAESVTANQIAAATITGEQIAANTITASHLSVTSLSAICANIGNLTINGYMTTNSSRKAYNSTTAGMTIDANGVGAYSDSSNFWNFGADGTVNIQMDGSANFTVSDGNTYASHLSIYNGYISLYASGYTASTSPLGETHFDPSGVSFYYMNSSAWCTINNIDKKMSLEGALTANTLTVSGVSSFTGAVSINNSLTVYDNFIPTQGVTLPNGFKLYAIEYGSSDGSIECAGTSLTSKTISFKTSFGGTPQVIVSIYSTTTSYNYGYLTAFVSSVNAADFTVTIANPTSTTYKPSIYWIAIYGENS